MNKKVLVISHNVFSKTESMGKTLSSYFSDFVSENLAQFYIHSEIPTIHICDNYYRITDKEMIKSVFTRKSGRIFRKDDVREDTENSRIDSNVTAQLYQLSRSRTPLIYILRNLWWSLGAWNTKKLRDWLDDFSPDAVFFASGDYAFMYTVARRIAEYKKIPLLVCCMDDFYLNNKNAARFGGKVSHRYFMSKVKSAMDYASGIFTICDKMQADYGKLFNKPTHTLYTSSSITSPLKEEKTEKISYIGNVSAKRNEQLVQIGRALKELSGINAPQYIDVYSAESRQDFLKGLTPENGIMFHGAVSSGEVKKIIGESLAVIHTESFDAQTRKRVAYSVSTKIADSLASGTCILAYGPGDVASIEYLKKNNAAYCITSPDMLKTGLKEFLTNAGLRESIVDNALRLAEKNHRPDKNGEFIVKTIEDVCNESITG